MSLRRVTDELEIDRRQQRRDDAQLRPMRVEGRNTDGTILLRRLDGTCVARGPICSAYEGQLIELPCAPPFRLKGAAGVPVARIFRTVATLWVEALDPEELLPGGTYSVTVTGHGFLPSFWLHYLVYPEPGELPDEINPHVTVTTVDVIDESTAVLEVTVSADAELTMRLVTDPLTGEQTLEPIPWPIAYDNVGSPD